MLTFFLLVPLWAFFVDDVLNAYSTSIFSDFVYVQVLRRIANCVWYCTPR